MKPIFLNRKYNKSGYVFLNTEKCKACWKCIENCPNHVIGKIDFHWHKHALIIEGNKCSGCLNCVKTCQFGAFSKAVENIKVRKQNQKILRSFVVNNILIISGLILILSGLILQLGFHIGGERNSNHNSNLNYEQIRDIKTSKMVLSFNYYDWSLIHKFSIIVFSLLMIYHIYVHWKWYKGVFTKNLITKNFQAISLSIIFLLVAITGLVPWFIDLLNFSSALRLILIELHDKLALLLIIYLILHVIKRNKWFLSTYRKLK